MARSILQQPMTGDPNNLVIGPSTIRVRKIDNDTAFGDTQADVTSSPLSVTYSLGAIQSSSLTAETAKKTHSSTYPRIEDARMNESVDVVTAVVTEELGSATVQALVQSILNRAAGATPDRWAVETCNEKVNGGGISFYQNNTQLIPEMTVTSQNDWTGVEMKFRSFDKSTYTNRSLVYRLPYTGTTRSLDRQPQTVDPNNMVIGFAQVRFGAQTPRPTTGGNGTVYKPRFYPASGSTTLYSEATSNNGLNYTGTHDGAFQVEITLSPYRIDGTQTGTTFDTSIATGDRTLSVDVDGGGAQAITFTDTDTNPIATCVSEINAILSPGATAYAASDNHVYIVSDTGPTGSIAITVENTSLGFTVAVARTTDFFTVTGPDGEVIASNTAITGAAQALDDGATITFGKTVDYFLGDTYIVGVEAGGARTAVPAATRIWNRHSYLRHEHSVGALQAATLSISTSLKSHSSGYPQILDAEIGEAVEILFDISAEEYAFSSGALVSGAASTPADMLFDSSINGISYYVPIEMVLEQFDGNVVCFWAPNCVISGQFNVSPGDDWAILPIQAAAQKQNDSYFYSGATAPNQVYLLTDNKYDTT